MRRLALECLEDRRYLAGNVRTQVVDGELIIRGDAGHNHIRIIEYFLNGDTQFGRYFRIDGYAFDGQYSSGQPKPGTSPTLVNGISDHPLIYAAADKLRILMGDGNDVVYLGDQTYGGNLKGLVINTGAGADYVLFSKHQMYSTNAAATITLGADSENEIDRLHMVEIYAPPAAITVNLGGGNDQLATNDFEIGRNFVVNAGSGSDNIRVIAAVIGGTTRLNLGSGTDTAYFFNNSLKSTVVHGGSTTNERDLVQVRYTQAVDLFCDLYGGNDEVRLVEDVYISRSTTINGGTGTDLLYLGPRVLATGLTTPGVEQIQR